MFAARSPLRETLGIGDRPILSTFGLIGPGKGLENAIRALPAIAAQYPDILYRIVGATHPNLLAAEGEAYRESLKALAEDLGVADNIAWDNRFLGSRDLLDQIELCDIYRVERRRGPVRRAHFRGDDPGLGPADNTPFAGARRAVGDVRRRRHSPA